MVEDEVQFERAHGSPMACPVKSLGAQFDHARTSRLRSLSLNLNLRRVR